MSPPNKPSIYTSPNCTSKRNDALSLFWSLCGMSSLSIWNLHEKILIHQKHKRQFHNEQKNAIRIQCYNFWNFQQVKSVHLDQISRRLHIDKVNNSFHLSRDTAMHVSKNGGRIMGFAVFILNEVHGRTNQVFNLYYSTLNE